MPHFRIYIKLEKEPVREYLIEDCRKEVDVVYNDYKRRVYEKNGAGRVIYFDLVMISEASLLHLEDRKEVFHEANDFGLKHSGPFKKAGKQKKGYETKPTLGDRTRK